MSYQFLEHLTRADIAFEATDSNLEELFCSAAEATLQTMVRDLATIREIEMRSVSLSASSLDLVESVERLLHDFLQKIVFYKDAELLLLKPAKVQLNRLTNGYELQAELWGEGIDPSRHDLIVDVKAVTLHQFQVQRVGQVWRAQVVLDV